MQASSRLARGMRLAGGGLLTRLEQHAAAGRTAIVDADGTTTSYAELLRGARAVGPARTQDPPHTPPGQRHPARLLWRMRGGCVHS